MSVKATIDGETWEFSTVTEAAEFKRSLTAQTMPSAGALPRRRGRPRKAIRGDVKRRASRVSVGSGLSDGSRQILEAIRRKPDGLQTEEFARAIGSPTPRKVPPRMMILGKELKALGLQPGDVVKRTRIYVKSRARSVFQPGPRLDEALGAK